MQATLDLATKKDEVTLDNLVQLYAHDFSEFVPLDVGEDGRFEGLPLGPYWVDAWRHAFLFRVGETLAGFALVHARSKLTAEDGVFDMAEFFVLRKFRRSGVGRAAAFALFDRFRGRWEVRQRVANQGATAFWRRVIGAYTHDRFEDTPWSNDVWTGPVQRFTS
jgi:predicted acetyltransferase